MKLIPTTLAYQSHCIHIIIFLFALDSMSDCTLLFCMLDLVIDRLSFSMMEVLELLAFLMVVLMGLGVVELGLACLMIFYGLEVLVLCLKCSFYWKFSNIL